MPREVTTPPTTTTDGASLEVRGEPTDIDAAWLTRVFDQAGVARGAIVLDVKFTGLIGSGQGGRVGRFVLTWSEPTDRPASVVGKFPSADPETRAKEFSMGSYEKEWWFYREIAHSVDASAPHCYAALFDESAPDFVLILEDLSNLRPADQLEGLSEDEVALAIDQAVKLHAPRFGDPSIEPLLWHRHGTASVNDFAARLQGAFEFTLPGFEERLGSQVGDEVLDLTRRLQPLVGRWAHGTDTPRTIRHIDFRADNFLFGEAPDAPPIVVVDWGGATPGLGACDVAFVIGGSFPDPAQRASMERELVEDYRQKMATAGVELSKDDCWRDYRFGSIWGLLISVMASMVAEQTERGDKMLSALAVRHSLQISELDALALLD